MPNHLGSRRSIPRWAPVLALVLAAAGACQKAPPASAPEKAAVEVSPAARKEAEELFATRCSTCHGATGQGDGPASAGLTPKPRNYHDKAWQASVTDEHIEKIIKFGGPAVGKSPLMPPNPDLESKPEVVTALRQHVRSLGQ